MDLGKIVNIELLIIPLISYSLVRLLFGLLSADNDQRDAMVGGRWKRLPENVLLPELPNERVVRWGCMRDAGVMLSPDQVDRRRPDCLASRLRVWIQIGRPGTRIQQVLCPHSCSAILYRACAIYAEERCDKLLTLRTRL
jgi:hypothetical protein